MSDLKYYETERARMEPDLYSGENCGEMKPRWIVGIDKQGDTDMGEKIVLRASNYPPGTQVIIKEPLCPNEDCGCEASLCDCGFNWKEWASNQFA